MEREISTSYIPQVVVSQISAAACLYVTRTSKALISLQVSSKNHSKWLTVCILIVQEVSCWFADFSAMVESKTLKTLDWEKRLEEFKLEA